MASFASSATTCGARKHAWTNNIYSFNMVWNRVIFIFTKHVSGTKPLINSDMLDG